MIVCLDQWIQLSDLPESVRQNGRAVSRPIPPSAPGEQTIFDVQRVELEELRKNLKQFQGNISDVAKAMGISRPTVYRKLKKYGLYPARNRYEE